MREGPTRTRIFTVGFLTFSLPYARVVYVIKTGCIKTLGHNQAAIDIECLPGDVAGAGAGEKQGHSGDVLRIVGAPDGNDFEAAPVQLFDGNPERLGALPQGSLRHSRACDPGANRVDVDIIAPELVGRGHGHGNDGAFAGRIGRIGGPSIPLSGDRSDINNPAPLALGNHLFCRLLHAEEHAFGVDTMDAVPVRLSDLHDVQITRHASVIHDHVQASECLHGLLYHTLQARELPDIRLDREAPAASGFDHGTRLLGRLPVDICRGYGGSSLSVL